MMRETSASMLFLRANTGAGEDMVREEEAWSPQAERLVCAWSAEWHARRDAHHAARRWWKRMHYLLDVPGVVVPIIVSGVWGKLPREEGSTVATATLTLSGCVTALGTVLQPGTKAEQHLHAAERYADLISDAEEVLAKARRHRPEVDLCVLGFKMRSDSLLRSSPPVPVEDPLATESEEEPGSPQISLAQAERCALP